MALRSPLMPVAAFWRERPTCSKRVSSPTSRVASLRIATVSDLSSCSVQKVSRLAADAPEEPAKVSTFIDRATESLTNLVMRMSSGDPASGAPVPPARSVALRTAAAMQSTKPLRATAPTAGGTASGGAGKAPATAAATAVPAGGSILDGVDERWIVSKKPQV
jgi:hypothetical protein